jgi:hypothetical protein
MHVDLNRYSIRVDRLTWAVWARSPADAIGDAISVEVRLGADLEGRFSVYCARVPGSRRCLLPEDRLPLIECSSPVGTERRAEIDAAIEAERSSVEPILPPYEA